MTNYDEGYELEDHLREADDEGIGRDLDAEGDDIHSSSTNSFDRLSLKNILKVYYDSLIALNKFILFFNKV